MNETLSRAERFIWSTARVLEQRRFEYRYQGGDREAVLTALAPYRTADGGYGYALEPDGRGPTSQPPHVWTALGVLEEIGAVDDAVCGYLESITTAGGGVPLALPSLEPYPRAPWWGIEPGGSLITTAEILAPLLQGGVAHPWVERATGFCWTAVDALGKTHPYEIEAAITFLDVAPERERAQRAAQRVGELARAQNLIGRAPDGYAAGETHEPHDFAKRPSSLARAWFSDAEIEQSLDALAAAQAPDGGWHPKWAVWTPATGPEWGGIVTLRALATLEAYGRLTSSTP